MSGILKIKTNKYQVFEMNYGVILLNREPQDLGEKEKFFYNVFFQGDDAENFLAEIDIINKKNINKSLIDNWLSEYDDVMDDLNTQAEFQNLGINISINSKKSAGKVKKKNL